MRTDNIIPFDTGRRRREHRHEPDGQEIPDHLVEAFAEVVAALKAISSAS